MSRPGPSPAEDLHRAHDRIRRLANWLDHSIPVPGTGYRIGWDAILGLLPGAGDLIGTLLSLWVIFQALQAGAPASVALRMLGNVAVDSFLSSVPGLGDVVDFFFKANRRNLRLLSAYLENPAQARRRSRWLIAGFAFSAILLVTCVAYAMYRLFKAVF